MTHPTPDPITPAAEPDEPTATEETTEGTEDPDDADDPQQLELPEPVGRRERRYKAAAQAAQAELAAAQATIATHVAEIADRDGQLAALRQRMVEEAVTRQGFKPAAVFAIAPAADLLDGEGLPDSKLIKAACKRAAIELGAGPRTPQFPMGMRLGVGGPPEEADFENRWESSFADRDRGRYT